MTQQNIKSLLFSFFILCTFTTYSQTKSLKLYSNFLFPKSERYGRIPIFEKNDGFEFEHFTLAFRKEQERTFWEFEAGFVRFQKTDTSSTRKHLDYHFRIERGIKIKESSNGKFKFYFSPALKVYHLLEKEDPKTISNFPRENWLGGINLAFFLRAQYHLTDKWYLDLNTSLIGANLGVDFHKIENPVLSVTQQTQGGFNFDLLNEQLIRLGLGFAF